MGEKKEDEKKEDEKKEDEKKEDEKKEDLKKDDAKNDEEKKDDEKKEDEKKVEEKKVSRDDYVRGMEGNCSKPCAPEYFGLRSKFDFKYFDKFPGRSCGELDKFIKKDCVKHGY